MIEVLSVTPEIYPLIKTGGLADVAGALPLALSRHEIAVRTLVPGYPRVMSAVRRGRVVADIPDLFGAPGKLIAARVGGLDLIVIDASHLYDRGGGIYIDDFGQDWTDNWQRYAALSWVAAELARGLVAGYRPGIIHAHDWQAALVAPYVAFTGVQGVKTVLTIHNLAFQGQFGADIFPQLRLPDAAFSVEGVEYYGDVGFLKGGLQCADAITTVSPSYAREIRTPEFGMGLDGLLVRRSADLHGILNGIDTEAWNPQTDTALAANYAVANTKRRGPNKVALAERFGIAQSDAPLFGLVSRLTWQKGIDLVADTVDHLVAEGAQLVVLGSGEPQYEAAMAAAADRHPGRVGFVAAYDEGLSHLLQGGSDAILVPSRFEPCGLTQLYALRYGAVPVVSRVGGLADTIIHANDAAVDARVATGVQFNISERNGFADAIACAVSLYRRPETWERMQKRGMKTNVSWDNSAEKYADLFRSLVREDA